MAKTNHFKYYKTSPEIIKLAVMYYVHFPLSLRQVEGISHERGIDVCHETIRYWWNKFGHTFSTTQNKNMVTMACCRQLILKNSKNGKSKLSSNLGASHFALFSSNNSASVCLAFSSLPFFMEPSPPALS